MVPCGIQIAALGSTPVEVRGCTILVTLDLEAQDQACSCTMAGGEISQLLEFMPFHMGQLIIVGLLSLLKLLLG